MTKEWRYRDLLTQIHLNEIATKAQPIAQPGRLATFQVMPMGAVRMNRRSMYNAASRLRVERYFAYKDELGKQIYEAVAIGKRFRLVDLESAAWWKFFLPMPTSWSAKKRRELANTGLTKTPDFDNLVKAVYDSVFDNDSRAYDVRSSKYWSPQEWGYIELHKMPF